MIRTVPMSRFALFGVLVAALALGACGRKGGLDAPPGGAAVIGQTGDQTGQQSLTGQPTQQNSQSGNNMIGRTGATGLPRIRGENKQIPLDVLLN